MAAGAGEMSGKPSLGIISHQPVSASMAGPSIRCLEFARALAGDADITLLAPPPSELEPEGFELREYGEAGLVEAAAGCDALVCQGYTLSLNPGLRQSGQYLIVDLYVPMALEALEQDSWLEPARRRESYANTLLAILDQAAAGDFFICASERQRDYWLGLLTAVGRVNPESYAADDTMRELIDVVPFGVSEEKPQRQGAMLKGVHPAIGGDDKLVLWGGGIYNWLDPLTPVRAMSVLKEKRPEFKLYFMGTRHPDPHVPRMRTYDEALELSRELGLLDKTVFFNERWVPYEERGSYLLEADAGISANKPHLETRFSFRTRILDYIWAGLPVVATDGDVLSDLVRKEGLGLVAPSGDAEAFAAMLEQVVDDGELRRRCRENLALQAERLSWGKVVAPVRARLSRLSAIEGREGGGQPAGIMAGLEQAELDRRQREIARLGEAVGQKAADIEKLWEMVAEKDRAIGHFREVIADKDRQLRNPLYRLKVIAANRLGRK